MKTPIHVGAALALTSLASAQLQPTFTEAQFRLDLSQQLRPGDAVLELKADRSRGGRVRLELEDRKMTLFRDDGRDMDERGGDGVYTGVVRADLQEERAIARDLQLSAERGVLIPIFEGRELVERVNSRTLVKRPRPMTIPIITTSASTTVEVDNSLMVTNPTVFADLNHSFNPCTGVGNPDGAWSFGHVMTELAGTNDPSAFAMDWLSNWGAAQTVNGDTHPRARGDHEHDPGRLGSHGDRGARHGRGSVPPDRHRPTRRLAGHQRLQRWVRGRGAYRLQLRG